MERGREREMEREREGEGREGSCLPVAISQLLYIIISWLS